MIVKWRKGGIRRRRPQNSAIVQLFDALISSFVAGSRVTGQMRKSALDLQGSVDFHSKHLFSIGAKLPLVPSATWMACGRRAVPSPSPPPRSRATIWATDLRALLRATSGRRRSRAWPSSPARPCATARGWRAGYLPEPMPISFDGCFQADLIERAQNVLDVAAGIRHAH